MQERPGQELSPPEQMARMITGYWVSTAVYVAAKLGLPDLLQAGPRSVEELARQTDTHAPSLYRLLRALASVGVFSEGQDRVFGLTPLAETLRNGVPGSQRAFAVMMGEECYQAFGGLLGSVRTGETAFETQYGKPVFQYIAEHPDKAANFDEAMVGVHGRETAAMLAAYDFSGIGRLADVGGGNGSLLCQTLQCRPALRGLLFDLPHVVDRAKQKIEVAGLSSRCDVAGGSFFESVPAGADAYLLRHVIHDWEDQECVTILRNVHRAMNGKGKLLVVESVIPPGNDPSFAKLLDLTMLVMPGGQERTESEYRHLFQAAGFRLSRIVPTDADVSVIEGEPV